MAGSWGHMVVNRPESPEEEGSRGWTGADIGKPYQDDDGSFPLVENMGDAVEAMEECYGMVWALAYRLAYALYGDAPRERVLTLISQAEESYKEGYKLGAGEPPRW